jgi:hypothetical protein
VESVLGPLRTSATSGLLYVPRWLWRWRIWWNEDWQGKPKYSEKTCPNSTLSTTNPTCQTWAAAVGSQRLTAMARPMCKLEEYSDFFLLCLIIVDLVYSLKHLLLCVCNTSSSDRILRLKLSLVQRKDMVLGIVECCYIGSFIFNENTILRPC